MSYKTIYKTSRQNQLMLLKNIFKQNNIDYRFLEQSSNTSEDLEVKVQVQENDRSRAVALLRENGFLGGSASGRSSVSMARFWLWLVVALIFIIVASVLINSVR